MFLPGIDESQGTDALLVSRGRYTLRLTRATKFEVKGEDARIDVDEPIADRVLIEYEILEAPDDAQVMDAETEEVAEKQFDLVGKTIQQSIYIMLENHPKYKADPLGLRQVADVRKAFDVPSVDDQVQWETAIEQGATASALVAASWRDGNNGGRYANNDFRSWRHA